MNKESASKLARFVLVCVVMILIGANGLYGFWLHRPVQTIVAVVIVLGAVLTLPLAKKLRATHWWIIGGYVGMFMMFSVLLISLTRPKLWATIGHMLLSVIFVMLVTAGAVWFLRMLYRVTMNGTVKKPNKPSVPSAPAPTAPTTPAPTSMSVQSASVQSLQTSFSAGHGSPAPAASAAPAPAAGGSAAHAASSKASTSQPRQHKGLRKLCILAVGMIGFVLVYFGYPELSRHYVNYVRYATWVMPTAIVVGVALAIAVAKLWKPTHHTATTN